jgi:hypothetical protein
MLLHGNPTQRVSDLDPEWRRSPYGGAFGVVARLSQMMSDVGPELLQNTGAHEPLGADGATVVAGCSCSPFE